MGLSLPWAAPEVLEQTNPPPELLHLSSLLVFFFFYFLVLRGEHGWLCVSHAQLETSWARSLPPQRTTTSAP